MTEGGYHTILISFSTILCLPTAQAAGRVHSQERFQCYARGHWVKGVLQVTDCEVRPDAEKSELPCTTVPETVEGRGNRMLPGTQSVVCVVKCVRISWTKSVLSFDEFIEMYRRYAMKNVQF